MGLVVDGQGLLQVCSLMVGKTEGPQSIGITRTELEDTFVPSDGSINQTLREVRR